jgi:Asp-tRNA(Asn)/Glu-tRNA(Gln) amidotransferase A subunit family amidase
VVGLKPTHGWAALDGVTLVAPTIDTIGVISRHVSEAAAVAAAIADDPATLTANTSAGQPRIGVLTSAFFGRTATTTATAISRTIGRLKAAGARIVELQPTTDLTDVHAAHRIITFAECAWQHRARYGHDRHRYGTRAQELIDLGLTTLAHTYLDAQRLRQHATAQFARLFEHADILAMPVTPEPAPARTTTGDSAFQIPWTLCGFPTLSLPVGLGHTLPLAIQLVGPPHRDGQLLAASHWCEEVIGTQLTPSLPT